MDDPREDRFPAADLPVFSNCPQCGTETSLTVPLLADWRDRRRVTALVSYFPNFRCSSCGAPVPASWPVVIVRPGDPIAVLFCIPKGSGHHLDRLQSALTALAAGENGVIGGPIASTSPELLPLLATQYSGFAITAISCPGQEWTEEALDWFQGMRRQYQWPDVAAAVNRFLLEDSRLGDSDIFAAEPALQDAAWDPVVRRIGRLTMAGQVEESARLKVKGRMRILAGLRLTGVDFDWTRPDVIHAADLLSQLTELQSSATRTHSDVARAISTGRALIAHARERFPPNHPLLLTALNDTAAALLDDNVAPDRSRIEARKLLATLREQPKGIDLRLLADATTNDAIAMMPQSSIADSDTAEAAMNTLRDAIHLHRLHSPDDPTRTVSTLVNLASMTRSRLAGDPAQNLQSALAIFDEALRIVHDPANSASLSAPDHIMLQSNRLSAMAELANLRPDDDTDRAVLDAIGKIDEQLDSLAEDHVVRAITLANFGAIVLEAQNRGSAVLPPNASDMVIRWLTGARDATRNRTSDDPGRIVATMNLAAALFKTEDAADAATALRLLTEATTALANSESTRLHHTLFLNLAQLHLAHGRFEDARDTLDVACWHADRVIDRAATTTTRLAQVAAAGDLFQRLAFVHTHLRDARSAVHTIERSRARWRAADRYDERAVDLAVREHLEAGESLLYTGACGLGTWTVILAASGGAAAWTSHGSTADLAEPLTSLRRAQRVADVSAALTQASAILATTLESIENVITAAGIDKFGVIAGGPLAGLPLGALKFADRSLDQSVRMTYLTAAQHPPADPAAQAGPGTYDTHEVEGLHPSNSPSETRPDVTDGRVRRIPTLKSANVAAETLAIGNPTGDLRFAATELDAVTRFDPNTRTPPPGVGARGWLLTQLPHARHVHLACHAAYDPANPLESRFVLGQDLYLTIADLAAVHTDSLELVVASCCQSGVVDPRAADELVGLAHALIAAGARSVIAALWDIDDAGTSLLIAKLYDELSKGHQPGVALSRAQHSIRDLRMSDIATLIATDADSWIPPGLHGELRALGLHPDIRNPESRPFADPAYWSSLVYIRA